MDIGARYAGSLVAVIGASTGIGLATATRPARAGARVAAVDLDEGEAADAAAGLPGDGHLAIGMNVCDPESVAAGLARATGHGPDARLDAIAHVAGGAALWDGFEAADDDAWRREFELNLMGPVRVIRAALPYLRRSTSTRPTPRPAPGPAGASVALVSTVNAHLALGAEAYSAAKAGLAPIVANLAAELGPEGIRVNAVAPGTVRTRVWDRQGGADRLAPGYPLRRVGEPDDIAAAIAFLCSPDASWITGVVLPVDGGLGVKRML